MREVIENMLGIMTLPSGKSLSNRVASAMQNMQITPGAYETRPGYYKYNSSQMFIDGAPAKVTMIEEYRNDLNRYMIVGDASGNLWGWDIDNFDGVPVPIRSGLIKDQPCTGAVMGGSFIVSNGIDKVLSIGLGLEISNAGIPAPEDKPTRASLVVGGDMEESAEYLYAYTLCSRTKGTESDPSPVSDVIETSDTQSSVSLRIPAMTLDADDLIDAVRIYRSTANEEILYLDTSLSDDGFVDYSGSEILFESRCADDKLGRVLGVTNDTEDGNDNVSGVPVPSRYLAAHQGRVWYFETGRYRAGTIAIYSGSPIVVGTRTTWTAGMKGMTLVIEGESRSYIIESVTNATTLTLTESFSGTSNLTASYCIYGPSSFLRHSYIDVDGYSKPESIVEKDWVNTGRGGGDIGTGICPVGNNLLAGHTESLWLITGSGSLSYEGNPVTLSTGVASHRSMANDGKGRCIFGSIDGVYITDGQNVTSITDAHIQNIFSGAGNPPWRVDRAKLGYSHAVFDPIKNRYLYWVCSTDAEGNVPDYCLVYDFNLIGDTPIGWWWWTVKATASAVINNADGIPTVYFANDHGYLNYFDDEATNDGAGDGDHTLRGVVDSATVNTLHDDDADFDQDGAIIGCPVHILWSSVGAEGQVGYVIFNDDQHLEIRGQWAIPPAKGDIYGIGAMDAYRDTVDMDLGTNLDKVVRRGMIIGSGTDSCEVSLFLDFLTDAYETQTLDVDSGYGWEKIYFGVNRAKHYRLRTRLYDVGKRLEVKSIELEHLIHGVFADRAKYDLDRPRTGRNYGYNNSNEDA